MRKNIDRLQNKYAEIYNDRLVRHGNNTSLVRKDPLVERAMEEIDKAKQALQFIEAQVRQTFKVQ